MTAADASGSENAANKNDAEAKAAMRKSVSFDGGGRKDNKAKAKGGSGGDKTRTTGTRSAAASSSICRTQSHSAYKQQVLSERDDHDLGSSSPSSFLAPCFCCCCGPRCSYGAGNVGVVFPWNYWYRCWWGFTVFWSTLTVFFETYQIAFEPGGLYPYDNGSSIVEYVFEVIFVVDIAVNFNLAYYDDWVGRIVYDRKSIARNYLRRMFWIDLIGVFPFYAVALACGGLLGVDNRTTQYLALLRLFRLVRLHRVRQLFDALQYNARISLMWLTLIRNFGAALVWTHFSACVMFFIARQFYYGDDTTWIGGQVSDLSPFERYVTSLYWSVVTFTTVGYGDFSPVNSAEQIWGMVYMLLNMIMSAWIIGSITLLIVKGDEKTGAYREMLQTVEQYATLHDFDKTLKKRLKNQLKLDFSNREIADESVLRNFPTAVRRKLLRRLYLPPLLRTSLMRGIRQQFVDSFLTTCHVEIISAGEDILQRGSISSDLYLLVEGTVKLMPWDYVGGGGGGDGSIAAAEEASSTYYYGTGTSIADSEANQDGPSAGQARKLEAGDFVNDVGFFTETPQADTVRTLTVCKTLTMSRSAYKMIAEDHPGSVLKILQNLLSKVEKTCRELGVDGDDPAVAVSLPKRLEVLNAGSVYDASVDGSNRNNNDSSNHSDVCQAIATVQSRAHLTAVQDLIQMHINKQRDDQVTRFLFAASRDDTATIALMCDQSFDPDSADYDSRTALMVAAMKGNVQAVSKLLEYQANPNLVDMHGSSALFEAVKNGHDTAVELLKGSGAELCMDENRAASTLCQAVFDGDVQMLRRLLRAGIDANSSDYDRRAAVHIAAAEGSVAALKALNEFGADFNVRDRWNHSVEDEAKSANAGPVLEYLSTRG